MENKTFANMDFSTALLEKGEYDSCVFSNCNFSNASLARILFIDCTFDTCNLSLANLTQTTLRDVAFKNCKMLGLRFDTCDQFGLSAGFGHCNLGQASFYRVKMKKTSFKHCNFLETDFSEADLSESVFDDCDFTRAAFGNTVLEKADLRTSVNYSIDPERNRIKKAKFSLAGISGLLDTYDIEIAV